MIELKAILFIAVMIVIFAVALGMLINMEADRVIRSLSMVPRGTLPVSLPNVADGVQMLGATNIEMSPEKFTELRYRTRMTPGEAAAHYEAEALKRSQEEARNA